MQIDQSKAVITGGASGIGKAIAKSLLSRGGKVVIADIDESAIASALSELGGNATGMTCNVRDIEDVDKLADDSWQHLGGVDLVFANAGLAPGAPLIEATADQFDVIYEVNIRGAWATCKAFALKMIANDAKGHLCVTGSEHSLGMQHPMMGHYTASKHALLGWADVMRAELPENVDISILCPGMVNTQLYNSTRNTELEALDKGTLELGVALMSQGMGAEQVAETCLKGIEQGSFFIPTHASARHAAERRWEEVDQSFSEFAPKGSESEKYEMNAILADTMTRFEQQK